MNNKPTLLEIARFIQGGVRGDIDSISIIGSYLIEYRVREGSDIDLLVAVKDLDTTTVHFDEVFYKDVEIADSMGKRKELNTKLGGIALDVTVIDAFNKPNNPLTDAYENAIGTCLAAYPIYGRPLADVFPIADIISSYGNIRDTRLAIVDEKIGMTKQKIREQGRTDLHILYELQKYVFIRECIRNRVFNHLSIKHPDLSIPNFSETYAQDLESCGVQLKIGRLHE
ncbi:hypothetical protein H7171_03845 [Candidatus Saccharibacteria bacterium]|nr:hypothetical protein [Candidatus Saccharibacteria bacterium]